MGTLLELAARLTQAAHEIHREMEGGHMFEKPCKLLQTEIQGAIGTYRYSWPQLAASTLAKKSANTPLLETGEFRNSIKIKLGYGEAWVGTNDRRALWFELGTSKMPPRPYLKPALHAQHHAIEAEFGNVLRFAIQRG